MGGSPAKNCSIEFGILSPDPNEIVTIFHDMPSNEIYNDGSLSLRTEMLHQTLRLPIIPEGYRLRIEALFDSIYGGFGVDNYKLYTPQRYLIHNMAVYW